MKQYLELKKRWMKDVVFFDLSVREKFFYLTMVARYAQYVNNCIRAHKQPVWRVFWDNMSGSSFRTILGCLSCGSLGGNIAYDCYRWCTTNNV